jgi:hypothetical protein
VKQNKNRRIATGKKLIFDGDGIQTENAGKQADTVSRNNLVQRTVCGIQKLATADSAVTSIQPIE